MYVCACWALWKRCKFMVFFSQNYYYNPNSEWFLIATLLTQIILLTAYFPRNWIRIHWVGRRYAEDRCCIWFASQPVLWWLTEWLTKELSICNETPKQNRQVPQIMLSELLQTFRFMTVLDSLPDIYLIGLVAKPTQRFREKPNLQTAQQVQPHKGARAGLTRMPYKLVHEET